MVLMLITTPLSLLSIVLVAFISTRLSVALGAGAFESKLFSRERRKLGFRRAHVVLIDLVEKRPVAHLQESGGSLPIPSRFLQSSPDCTFLRFPLDALDQRL